MTVDKTRTPVIVGVGQWVERNKSPSQIDPVDALEAVCRKAAADAGFDDTSSMQCLRVVQSASLFNVDPRAELCSRLSIDPVRASLSGHGGSNPQSLLNYAAREISQGKEQLTLICGAETFYTEAELPAEDDAVRAYFRKVGIKASLIDRLRHWTHEQLWLPSNNIDRGLQALGQLGTPRFTGDLRLPFTPKELAYGFGYPTDSFALFENAFCAQLGLSPAANRESLAHFCSELSAIAATHPYSVSTTPMSAAEIGSDSEENRMISYPYNKRMCANMKVNQAAALIVCSWAQAEALGVDSGKLVFIRSCGEAQDGFLVERPNLWQSPSIADAFNQALQHGPCALDEIDHIDLYSCFPCAPRITAATIGLPIKRASRLSLTGGLAYFGGPGNNYSTHAVATIADRLRVTQSGFGLNHALSWYFSKNAVAIYSAKPPESTPQIAAPLKTCYPRINRVRKASGAATMESWFLNYQRDGSAKNAVMMGRDSQHRRFMARMEADPALVQTLTTETVVGRKGQVKFDRKTGKNRFYLD